MSRVTMTLSPETRERIITTIRRMKDGDRVMLMDDEANAGQKRAIHAALGQLAKRGNWHGRRLTRGDWEAMIVATLKVAQVVPGLDPHTVVVLGERLGVESMSRDEACNFLAAADALAADLGIDNDDERSAQTGASR
jgi:hypothetical protein